MNRFSVSEHEDGYWYMRQDEDGEWVSYKDYQQLMEKAVEFAEELVAIAQANCEYHPEAEAFLKEHGK